MNHITFSAMLTFILAGFNVYQNDELSKSMMRGKDIYTDFCMVCHKPKGEGNEKIFPPLSKSDFLTKNRNESIRAVKYGQKGIINVNGIEYNGTMPSPGLTDDEVADVMNYILNSWGNKDSKIVTIDEVRSLVK